MNRIFALALLAMGFATTARADYIPATWTDSANVGSGVYIGNHASYTYTHNLTDNGFTPGNDLISSFNLSIRLADDRDPFGDSEAATVFVPGAGIRTGSVPGVFNFGASGAAYGGWSFLGLLQLNLLGTLTVTISSIYGDFNLVSSTLTASGLANTPTSVPEPGALGLLGIGLMGMAMTLRRRQLAKRS